MLYTTLAYAKRKLGADLTVDDNDLLETIRDVSGKFDSEMGVMRPLFVPTLETREFIVESGRINSFLRTFDISHHPNGGYLLDLDAAVVGSTTLTVGTHVNPFPSATVPPFKTLRLISSTYSNWYGFNCTSELDLLTLSVTGKWGLHRDYANAWTNVDTLAAAIVSTSATSFTVANVDGVDVYGVTPRISAGNLVRIDDEYMDVISTDTGTNTVNVRRGVLGTTAATHLISAPVATFQVENAIRRVAARQAGLMLKRQGAYVTVEVQGMSEVRYPQDLLAEVRSVLHDMGYL